ncbi:type II toxin-antitoxin system Phd/YefM family antitoxin [Chlorobium sp. KB01]|uniref:type II toxin-antitoxin system Phd/YefM family antitoxin n=1 Tax=Chlorobium sp. KB01 TaxID=1917528 RepID=UPI00097550EA|nr:type II toxin-antitoxin system Phd/YefM family antitoxin [Chlorobium sp. KB01]
MGSINLEEDIRPLSEFRANTASLVKLVKKTGRPLVLTQHGKSTVVLLDVRQYQSMVSSIEHSESAGAAKRGLKAEGIKKAGDYL